jgi:DNA polymerase III alpha subunit (gram-positive type)
LRSLYAYLKNQHPAIDQHIFVQHLELPPVLLPFGQRLFQAFIKAGNDSGQAVVPPHQHQKASVVSSTIVTQHQFLVGVEKCCKAGISQQLRFLFAMYEDDSNVPPSSSSAQVVEETERKEQVKSMLCDGTFLAKLHYASHNTDDQPDEAEAEQKDGEGQSQESEEEQQQQEEEQETQQKKQEVEEKKKKKQQQRNGEGTLEATGEDLHVWEKKVINPMLEGLLLYCEREGAGTNGGRTVSIDTFVGWAAETVTHLFTSTVEVRTLLSLLLLFLTI